MSREPISILAVDDDPLSRELLADILRRKGYRVECAEDGRKALRLIEKHAFPVVVTDLKMPGLTGIELLKETKSVHPETEVIIETAYGSIEGAVEAVKYGAFDYITKPFSRERIETLVGRAVERYELKKETLRLREELGHRRQAERIIGRHPLMQSALDRARLAARSDATVLIRGESGTGKDLFARLLHEQGPRRDHAFVKVNCAALPESLLDAELFGHERGAFTSAYSRRIGRFEKAHLGTIFLDEIGDLLPSTQVHLLNVLQDRRLERLGSNRPIEVDVRVIAATNRNLEDLRDSGRFRDDLYYRLKVVQLTLPPLRERREDIPLLATHFLQQLVARYHAAPVSLTPEAWELIMAWDWPGNARELENAIESALVVSAGRPILPSHLPQQIRGAPSGIAGDESLMTLQEGEKTLIRRALERTGGNRSAAARLLRIDRSTLARKMASYGLTPSENPRVI